MPASREGSAGGSASNLLGAEVAGAWSLAPDGLDEEILARVGPEVALRPGDRVALELNLRAAHLFDPASTRALPRSGAEAEMGAVSPE